MRAVIPPVSRSQDSSPSPPVLRGSVWHQSTTGRPQRLPSEWIPSGFSRSSPAPGNPGFGKIFVTIEALSYRFPSSCALDADDVLRIGFRRQNLSLKNTTERSSLSSGPLDQTRQDGARLVALDEKENAQSGQNTDRDEKGVMREDQSGQNDQGGCCRADKLNDKEQALAQILSGKIGSACSISGSYRNGRAWTANAGRSPPVFPAGGMRQGHRNVIRFMQYPARRILSPKFPFLVHAQIGIETPDLLQDWALYRPIPPRVLVSVKSSFCPITVFQEAHHFPVSVLPYLVNHPPQARRPWDRAGVLRLRGGSRI